MDETFKEIKDALSKNCDECKLIDQKIAYIVEFKNKEDADWFENEVVYPEGKMENSPIKNVMTFSKDAEEFAKVMYSHAYTFEVKDKNRLIEKIKER